jgi:hypothetical protein
MWEKEKKAHEDQELKSIEKKLKMLMEDGLGCFEYLEAND